MRFLYSFLYSLFIILSYLPSTLKCQTWTFSEIQSDFEGESRRAQIVINPSVKFVVQTADISGSDLKIYMPNKGFKNNNVHYETPVLVLFSFDKTRVYSSKGLIDYQKGIIRFQRFSLNGWTSAYHNMCFINDLKNSKRLVVKIDRLLGMGMTMQPTRHQFNGLNERKYGEVFFTEVIRSNQENHQTTDLIVPLSNSSKSIDKAFKSNSTFLENAYLKFNSDSFKLFQRYNVALIKADLNIPNKESMINEYIKNTLFVFDKYNLELSNINNCEVNTDGYREGEFKIYFFDDEYKESLFAVMDKIQDIPYYFPYR